MRRSKLVGVIFFLVAFAASFASIAGSKEPPQFLRPPIYLRAYEGLRVPVAFPRHERGRPFLVDPILTTMINHPRVGYVSEQFHNRWLVRYKLFDPDKVEIDHPAHIDIGKFFPSTDGKSTIFRSHGRKYVEIHHTPTAGTLKLFVRTRKNYDPESPEDESEDDDRAPVAECDVESLVQLCNGYFENTWTEIYNLPDDIALIYPLISIHPKIGAQTKEGIPGPYRKWRSPARMMESVAVLRPELWPREYADPSRELIEHVYGSVPDPLPPPHQVRALTASVRLDLLRPRSEKNMARLVVFSLPGQQNNEGYRLLRRYNFDGDPAKWRTFRRIKKVPDVTKVVPKLPSEPIDPSALDE